DERGEGRVRGAGQRRRRDAGAGRSASVRAAPNTGKNMTTIAPKLYAPLLDDGPTGEELEREKAMVDDGISRYLTNAAKSIERGDGASLKPAARFIQHWFPIVAFEMAAMRDRCR